MKCGKVSCKAEEDHALANMDESHFELSTYPEYDM